MVNLRSNLAMYRELRDDGAGRRVAAQLALGLWANEADLDQPFRQLLWITYWHIRDWREQQFVRKAFNYLGESGVVYLHSNGESPATAALARIENVKEEGEVGHSHLEGK